MLINHKCASCYSDVLREVGDPYNDRRISGIRYLRCEDCGQLHEYPVMQQTSRGVSLRYYDCVTNGFGSDN